MANSITQSTKKQYESSLKQWWLFTRERNYDMFSTDTVKVVGFLIKRFQSGAKYGTLNSDKAAISPITEGKFTENKLITRFRRVVLKEGPTRSKYATTWDIDLVLNYIENVSASGPLKMKELAEKIVTLPVLITAYRLQMMALIEINNIKVTESEIEIKIPDLIKTSRPGVY